MKGLLTFLVCFVICSGVARAELGKAPIAGSSSIKKSKRIKSLQQTMASDPGYTVHESIDGLTTVDEYVNADGIVFAVTWSGRKQIQPDSFLGSYYSDYEQGKSKAKGQRQQEVNTPRLKAGLYGHMGAFRGRACDPTLTPAGINCEDLP